MNLSLNLLPPRLRPLARAGVPLAPLTTFRIGGAAALLVEPASLRDVSDLLAACRASGVPLFVLGGGSNLLVSDEGVPGVVVSLARLKKIQVIGSHVIAQAGANLATLVTRCSQAGVAGPQALAGIPGTVGGALAMNAGGRHGEIADWVERVIWVNPRGELESLYREEIAFGYRSSTLREGVVVEAWLHGGVGEPAELAARARTILQEKLAAQPYSEFSAGCAFQNPKGMSAGRLIDLAGCKGLGVGGAQVSTMHGNFIVNTGSATASQVLELMRVVQERVQAAHGVRLEPEVRIWPACAPAA